jgi:hypothetical protein
LLSLNLKAIRSEFVLDLPLAPPFFQNKWPGIYAFGCVQITNEAKKLSDQSGLEFFDIYYIPFCHNHSRYFYLAAAMALRSMVGALS